MLSYVGGKLNALTGQIAIHRGIGHYHPKSAFSFLQTLLSSGNRVLKLHHIDVCAA